MYVHLCNFLTQIRDLLQGKLPFAGVEWVEESSEDVTDDSKQTNDSNLLVQDETFAKPLSGEGAITLATTESDASGNKSLTSNDNTVVNKSSTMSGSDDSTVSFDAAVAGHNMNREELMKAVFEDNTADHSTKQSTGLNTTKENIFGDSHYNPDEWVDVPNDDLI